MEGIGWLLSVFFRRLPCAARVGAGSAFRARHRSCQTPTSLYLALQYGIFTANYPLTDEDLETGKLPKVLQPYVAKLYGLTIGAERLQQIRQERRPGSRYASPQQVPYEVRTALSLFERQGIPHLDVSECNVEEIASRILDRMKLERRVRV